MQWQLYIASNNKLYRKMSNSEALLWNDGAANTDSVIKAESNRGITEILSYKCDELILHCKAVYRNNISVLAAYLSRLIATDHKAFEKFTDPKQVG